MLLGACFIYTMGTLKRFSSLCVVMVDKKNWFNIAKDGGAEDTSCVLRIDSHQSERQGSICGKCKIPLCSIVTAMLYILLYIVT